MRGMGAYLGVKHLMFVLEETDTDEAVCSRKVASERRVVDAIRSLYL